MLLANVPNWESLCSISLLAINSGIFEIVTRLVMKPAVRTKKNSPLTEIPYPFSWSTNAFSLTNMKLFFLKKHWHPNTFFWNTFLHWLKIMGLWLVYGQCDLKLNTTFLSKLWGTRTISKMCCWPFLQDIRWWWYTTCIQMMEKRHCVSQKYL